MKSYAREPPDNYTSCLCIKTAVVVVKVNSINGDIPLGFPILFLSNTSFKYKYAPVFIEIDPKTLKPTPSPFYNKQMFATYSNKPYVCY